MTQSAILWISAIGFVLMPADSQNNQTTVPAIQKTKSNDTSTAAKAKSADDLAKQKPHPKAFRNTHATGEVDKPELVKFIVKKRSKLKGIVVDETQAKLVGEWQYSTHTPPYVGIGYLHDRKRLKGESSVTFTPDLPKEGVYEVRLSHCYNVRRSTNTPITIHYGYGEKTIRINQQQIPKHGKLFRSLGRFKFKAGKNGWVRISNKGTDGKYVIADAVQFIPIEPAEISGQVLK